METLKKVEKIFKWIILGIILINVIIYFLPLYERVYYSSYYSKEEITRYYLYEGSYGISYISIITVLILALTAVCMFADIKNKEFFVAAFGVAYFLQYLFTLMNIRKIVKYPENSSYKFSYCYGYYFLWIFLILLFLSIICWFVIKVLIKCNTTNSTINMTEKSSEGTSKLDILKQRIEVLNDLKEQGILTEDEYNQKRSDIVKDLKF